MRNSPALHHNIADSKKPKKSQSFEKQEITQTFSGGVTVESRLSENNEIGQVFGNLPISGIGNDLEGDLLLFTFLNSSLFVYIYSQGHCSFFLSLLPLPSF